MPPIAQQIQSRRRQLGLTPGHLVRATGLHKSNVSRIEAGKHNPSLSTLEQIAAALGCRIALVPLSDADPS